MSNPAATPSVAVDVVGDDRWMSLAQEKEPEVLIVGDSIIQMLAQDEIWDKMFVPLHCLNFGIGGDQTQHVLWRLTNGELEGFAPKVIVVLAGTNNPHTASEIIEGLMEIVKTCQDKQPQADVLVMGIPPRGEVDNPLRHKIAAINAGVAEQIRQMTTNVHYLDVDPRWFIGSDGCISHHDMYDYLHFTRAGYRKLVEPLLEEIQTLLKHFATADLTLTDEEAN